MKENVGESDEIGGLSLNLIVEIRHQPMHNARPQATPFSIGLIGLICGWSNSLHLDLFERSYIDLEELVLETYHRILNKETSLIVS